MFDVMTITRKGLELLAQATAANKLVIVGCDATADFTDAATAATTSARPANPLASTTEVTILSASNTSVFTRAAFIAGTSTGGGQAKSFFLYGHSANDTAHDYVICVASTNISVHIPLPGELINTYGLEFETVYSGAGDTVTVTGTANYCTLAEFNVLKERTVTTHKEGDDAAGDDQTIRGKKTFLNEIEVSHGFNTEFTSISGGGISFNRVSDNINYVVFMGGGSSTNGVNAVADIIVGEEGDPENITKLIIKHSENTVSDNGLWFCINSEDEQDAIASISYNNDRSDYELYASNLKTNSLTATESSFKILAKRNSISASTIEFNQYTGIGLMLGTTTEDINVVSGGNILLSAGTGFGTVTLSGILDVSGNVTFGANVGNGSNSTNAGNLYYNSTSDGESNGNLKLSKLSGSQESLYIAEAATHAKVNSSDNTKADCPVGSIVYAILPKNIKGSGVKVNPGEKFEITGGANVAKFSSSGWSSDLSLPTGWYKALHSIVFTGEAQPFNDPVLIQRVADDAT